MLKPIVHLGVESIQYEFDDCELMGCVLKGVGTHNFHILRIHAVNYLKQSELTVVLSPKMWEKIDERSLNIEQSKIFSSHYEQYVIIARSKDVSFMTRHYLRRLASLSFGLTYESFSKCSIEI